MNRRAGQWTRARAPRVGAHQPAVTQRARLHEIRTEGRSGLPPSMAFDRGHQVRIGVRSRRSAAASSLTAGDGPTCMTSSPDSV